MKLVIDIPEEEYNECKMQVEMMKQEGFLIESLNTALRIFIANGTPLPKGHGRLIDADELYEDFIDGTEGYDCNTWSRIEIGDIIEDTPTIIEADKEEL